MLREERDVVGALVRREFETARTQLVPFRRWLEARDPSAEPTFDLLPEFERASLWELTSAHFAVGRSPGSALDAGHHDALDEVALGGEEEDQAAARS